MRQVKYEIYTKLFERIENPSYQIICDRVNESYTFGIYIRVQLGVMSCCEGIKHHRDILSGQYKAKQELEKWELEVKYLEDFND